MKMVMKSKAVIPPLILVFAISIIGFLPVISKWKEPPSLTLEINAQKSTYQLGAEIPVIAHIKNTGYSNLVINRRMSVNFPGSPKLLRDITFTIKGPTGSMIPFIARINVRPATSEDVIILSSGDVISETYYLGRLYDFSQIGSYEITASYQNSSEIDGNRSVWQGEIKSNALVIEIVP